MKTHKFDYRWTLKDARFTKDKGVVFSCFACGGGSSMGYKLAGFDVIGCNEIDHRMMYAYCQNHNPKFLAKSEVCCISSFPQDYNFGGQSPHYVCGMSVPPVMMAQVASRIWEQWLSKI